MDLQLNQKIALVTGSYRGTGLKIAEILREQGATVILHGFRRNEVEKAAATASFEHFVAADIHTDKGAKELFESLLASHQRIDLLINNHGSYAVGKWDSATIEEWMSIYQKNTLSAVRLIRHALPEMKKQGFGRIVQIGTVGSFSPSRSMPHYYASKAALASIAVSLAKEASHSGITVNTISPGLIKTPELELYYREKAARKGWGKTWEEIEKAIVEHDYPNPVGRIGRCEDIGNLVAFLCSPQAAFINGQNIRVDGGYLDLV